MPSPPTLEDLEAQLAMQNAELDEAERLAESMPAEVTIDARALEAFDDVVEPRPAAGAPPCFHGIRA